MVSIQYSEIGTKLEVETKKDVLHSAAEGRRHLYLKLIWGLLDSDCLRGGFWVPPESHLAVFSVFLEKLLSVSREPSENLLLTAFWNLLRIFARESPEGLLRVSWDPPGSFLRLSWEFLESLLKVFSKESLFGVSRWGHWNLRWFLCFIWSYSTG